MLLQQQRRRLVFAVVLLVIQTVPCLSWVAVVLPTASACSRKKIRSVDGGVQHPHNHIGSPYDRKQRRHRVLPPLGLLKNQRRDSEGEDDASTQQEQEPINDNDTPLGRLLRGISQATTTTNNGNNKMLEKGSIVVAKADIPTLGIWMDQTYELTSVYWQGLSTSVSASGTSSIDGKEKNSGVSLIEKIPQSCLDTSNPTAVTTTTTAAVDNNNHGDDRTTLTIPPGYTLYIELYNPIYHKKTNEPGRPVKVTPQEVGLVSLQTEVVDSVLFALPVLGFWTTLAWTFARLYNERYGGNFIDALFRT